MGRLTRNGQPKALKLGVNLGLADPGTWLIYGGESGNPAVSYFGASI